MLALGTRGRKAVSMQKEGMAGAELSERMATIPHAWKHGKLMLAGKFHYNKTIFIKCFLRVLLGFVTVCLLGSPQCQCRREGGPQRSALGHVTPHPRASMLTSAGWAQ